MTDSERERIRKEKLEKLKQEAMADEKDTDSSQQSKEEKIETLVVQATTSEARKRLNTVEMAKPELVEEVKRQIAQVQASGNLAQEITDDKMKELLSDAHEQSSTDFDIKRR